MISANSIQQCLVRIILCWNLHKSVPTCLYPLSLLSHFLIYLKWKSWILLFPQQKNSITQVLLKYGGIQIYHKHTFLILCGYSNLLSGWIGDHMRILRPLIFRQHAASIYGFVCYVTFVCYVKKKCMQLLSKVGGWNLVCWLFSQI